jgi:signal transduction histidine kinase
MKHACASRVDLLLEQNDETIRLTIRDNGIGISSAKPHKISHGMSGMRYRVKRWSGQFHVDSTPGAGTTIRVTVPAVATAADEPAEAAVMTPV